MFKKILIVDDIDAVNKGVEAALIGHGIKNINYSAYCDDALLKIKRASHDKDPYDLIICDLSFVQDHRLCEICSGKELLEKIKASFPMIKTVVFSIEEDPQTIRELWERLVVDSYICKDRSGLLELAKALKNIDKGQRYLPQRLEMLLKQQNTIVLSTYDERLLRLLAQGNNQNEIELIFKKEGTKPSSRSSIEKRLKDLRDDFEAHTNVHLITILKDYGLM